MAPPAAATHQDAPNYLPGRSQSFTTRYEQGNSTHDDRQPAPRRNPTPLLDRRSSRQSLRRGAVCNPRFIRWTQDPRGEDVAADHPLDLDQVMVAISLNNQHGLEGSDVVAGQGNCANARGQVGLVFTSSSEEEAGEPFSTECPLSVALKSRSRPPRHADRDIPVRVVT